MALTGDVKIPVVGSTSKKTVAGVLVVVTGIAGIYYFRTRKSSSATAPAATSTNQYPPDGTTGNPSDPYSTDPATGQTYGDEATGSGGTFGAFPFDQGQSPGSTGVTDTGTTTPSGPPFASNSAWTNWVISQLQSQNPAINAGALLTALGLYVEGQPVDAAQKALIFEARAVGGDPPVAGASGFPPNIRMNAGKGGHVTAHNPVSGLREEPAAKGEARISWHAEPHATGYKASLSGGAVRHDTVTGSSHAFLGLKAGHYTASVLATPASAGARPATITVTVK